MREAVTSRIGSTVGWATEPSRRVPIVLGLTGLSMLAMTTGGNPVPVVVSILWLAIAVLLGVFRFRPVMLAGGPVWLRPPHLTRGAALVLAYIALIQFQLSGVALLWWAGTVVFVTGALRDGQLGPFSPTLLTRGWARRLVTAGALLVALALASRWLGDMYYAYTAGDYYYSGTVGGGTAHHFGRAALPTAAALAMLVVAGWAADSPHWRRLRSLVLPTAVVLGFLGIRAIVKDQQHFNEILEAGSAYTMAVGPWLLGLAAALLAAGGVLLRRQAETAAG